MEVNLSKIAATIGAVTVIASAGIYTTTFASDEDLKALEQRLQSESDRRDMEHLMLKLDQAKKLQAAGDTTMGPLIELLEQQIADLLMRTK